MKTKRVTQAELAWASLCFSVSEEICLAQERAKLSDAVVAKRAGMNTIRYKFLKQGVAPAVEYRELAAVAATLGCRLHLFLADLDTDEWEMKRAADQLKTKAKPPKPKAKKVKGDWLTRQLANASKEAARLPTAREKPDIFGQLDNLGKG